MNNNQYVLEVNNISKSFPGVRALNKVDLKIKKGTVHALLGENGAGKSTLMKIITGIYIPDEGEITFDGQSVLINSPHIALELGITMIHQELSPVLEMKVSDNIFLGREPLKKVIKLVDKKKLYIETEEIFKKLKIEGISPSKKMKELTIAQMQMVEIVKAVSQDAKLIIMDEPTSAISEKEVNTLFRIIKSLKEKGITIIFISHKLDEIYSIADDVTVLRDGEFIGSDIIDGFSRNKLISMMVGREIKNKYKKRKYESNDVVFEIRDLSLEGVFENISFKLHKGEILGIGGLMGSKRTDIVETIFGLHKNSKGEIFKDGEKITIKNARDAIKNKIAFAPEDRKMMGLILCLSLKRNITISDLSKIAKLGLIKSKEEKKYCEEYIDKLRIKTPGLDVIVNNLSGGNQQKVVLAKWLYTAPEILILDEPTRGIDVGAKEEIYNIMTELAMQGKSIIMISSEMPELIRLCDRVITVHEGILTGELTGDDITQENIMLNALL